MLPYLAALSYIAYRLWRLEMSVTRKQFEDNLAATVPVIAKAVTDAIEPKLEALKSGNDDFTTSQAALDALPAAVATAVSASVDAILNPPADTTAATATAADASGAPAAP